MNDYIDSLKKEQQEKADYIAKLELIQQEFPDVHKYSTRWSKVLCSKLVNAIAQQVDFGYSCGCCPDASLFVKPFVEREGLRIYSDPARIYIGEQAYYGGDYPIDDWEENIQKAEIKDPIIIELIKQYFKENPPGRIVYDNEEY